MSDQPGCPCSICDADFADTKRLQMNASVDHTDDAKCGRSAEKLGLTGDGA